MEAVGVAQDFDIRKKAEPFHDGRHCRTAGRAFTLVYKDDAAMTDLTRFAGIDVSKSNLDLFILPDRHSFTFANTRSGIEHLLDQLKTYHPIHRVVLEPTGGYERLVLRGLLQADLPVSRVNALQVRHFARASGLLAKTDRIDAMVLADYGQRMPTRMDSFPSENRQKLADLVARHRQLTQMLVQEKNRLEKQENSAHYWVVQMIKHLNKQRGEVDQAMTDCAQADEEISKILPILMSMKGIGLLTACILIAELPELGLLGKGQIAKLVGVAPINRDSGSMRGKRMIAGGRKPLRNALYLAALPAIRFDPLMRGLYQRLIQKGKPGKVALVAVVRKMVVILNARMREHYAAVLDT